MDGISVPAEGYQLGAIRAEENTCGQFLIRVLETREFPAVRGIEQAYDAGAGFDGQHFPIGREAQHGAGVRSDSADTGTSAIWLTRRWTQDPL
jgi:hypothetical protein